VNDDKDGWEQEGDPLSDVVQEILGQYFEFNDEIVEAVVSAEDVALFFGAVLAFFGAAYGKKTHLGCKEGEFTRRKAHAASRS
jgi:hypothetical protein